MSEPLDFSKGRTGHIREFTGKSETGVVCLVKSARRSLYERLADTTSGSALLRQLDGNPVQRSSQRSLGYTFLDAAE